MTGNRTPRLATWLAQRLITGRQAESLLGDLAEQYAQRRSALWYWRQVVAAMVVSTIADIRDHKLLACRAILVGSGLYVVLAEGVIRATTALRYAAADVCGRFHPDYSSCISAGWVVREIIPRALACLACVAIGWILARLDRDKPLAFVLLFAASVFVFEYGMMTWMFAASGIVPHSVPMILPAVFGLGRPGGVLLGGLLGQRQRHALHRLG